MTTRIQHYKTILSMLTRACKQQAAKEARHIDTDNERQQITYLAKMLIFSL